MFVITVRDEAIAGKMTVVAQAEDAASVAKAERVLTAIHSALARLAKAEGRRDARSDPDRKTRRKAWKKFIARKTREKA
jgi:hypothetical protein